MYNEKQKVSKIKRTVMRMKNNCFDSQEELMQEVIKILCADKTEMKMFSSNWNKDYNYSDDDFENDNSLLRELDMSREYHQIMTNGAYMISVMTLINVVRLIFLYGFAIDILLFSVRYLTSGTNKYLGNFF